MNKPLLISIVGQTATGKTELALKLAQDLLNKHYKKVVLLSADSKQVFQGIAILTGADIPIEQRDPKEVSHILGRAITLRGVRALNPAFDVTPQDLVSAIITEKGVITPPFAQNLRSHVHRT